MEFAPKRKTIKGTFRVAVINIQWANRKAKGSEQNVLTNLITFCMNNSRGQYVINGRAFKQKVDLPAKRNNLNKAEKICMDKNPGFDYYLIINNNVKSFSNAGGKRASLKSAQVSTAIHEFMHLLSLEHSGCYVKKNNKWTLLAYGDRESCIGKYPSGFLVAPQYWWLGWWNKEEVISHDYSKESTYTLMRIQNRADKESTKAVRVVIPGQVRSVFISFSTVKNMLRIHFQNRGGSQLIKETNTDFFDDHFTGIIVKNIKREENTITFTVSHRDVEIVDQSDEECFLGLEDDEDEEL